MHDGLQGGRLSPAYSASCAARTHLPIQQQSSLRPGSRSAVRRKMSSSFAVSKEHQRALPLTARQPFCAIWLVVNITALAFVRLPFWCLYYLPHSNRPNPKWTWRSAIMVQLAQFHHSFTPGLRPEQTAAPKPGGFGGSQELFELIQPIAEESLKGVASSSNTDVRSAARPGQWYPAVYDATIDKNKKVVMYLFGGAYVIGGHTSNLYAGTLDRLLPAVGNALFFGVGYRLASTKGNHFPSQLIDALSAYKHLLGKGIAASNIILLGDSAGGNCALALLRYLTEHPDLPLLSAALLVSPWVDLSIPVDKLFSHPNRKSEFIMSPLIQWGVDSFPSSRDTLTDSYISPVLHPFKISVPIHLDVDANELFFEQVRSFYEKIKALPGNDVSLHLLEEGTHATFMYGQLLGFPERVDQSVESIKGFLSDRKLL